MSQTQAAVPVFSLILFHYFTELMGVEELDELIPQYNYLGCLPLLKCLFFDSSGSWAERDLKSTPQEE